MSQHLLMILLFNQNVFNYGTFNQFIRNLVNFYLLFIYEL